MEATLSVDAPAAPAVATGSVPVADKAGRAVLPLLGRVAVGLLLLAARLPIWRAVFQAPQYPDGLNVAAYGNRVEGDLGEITELSHYIGMPAFNFAGMPEMTLWLPVILVAIVAAVVAVATRRLWLRRIAYVGLWLIPIGALADVQLRLWQVGHSLDPTSPIRVSPFTPLVVGPTTLMNFTVQAYPGMALCFVALAAALVTWTPLVVRRLTQGSGQGTSGRAATTGKGCDTEPKSP